IGFTGNLPSTTFSISSFIKETCGPNNSKSYSFFLAFVFASLKEKDSIDNSICCFSSSFLIFCTNILVDIPALQATNTLYKYIIPRIMLIYFFDLLANLLFHQTSLVLTLQSSSDLVRE